MDEDLTIRNLMALFAADIDIFLLQNEDQTGDKLKIWYTKEEIRNQLEDSLIKFVDTLETLGIDVNERVNITK